MFPHADDVVLIDPDFSGVGAHESHNQLEGDTLARTAASEQAQSLTLFDMERHIIQHAFCAERFHHPLEFHCDASGCHSYGRVRKEEEDALDQQYVRNNDQQ